MPPILGRSRGKVFSYAYLALALAFFFGASTANASDQPTNSPSSRHAVQVAADRAAENSSQSLDALRALHGPDAQAMLALFETARGKAGPRQIDALLKNAEQRAAAAWSNLDGEIGSSPYVWNIGAARKVYHLVEREFPALAKWADADAGTPLAQVMRRAMAVFRRVDAIARIGAIRKGYGPNGPDAFWQDRRRSAGPIGFPVDWDHADFSLRIPCHVVLTHARDSILAFDNFPSDRIRTIIGAPSDCPLPAFALLAPSQLIAMNLGNSGYDLFVDWTRKIQAAYQTPGDMFAVLANLRPRLALSRLRARRAVTRCTPANIRQSPELYPGLYLWRVADDELTRYYVRNAALSRNPAKRLAAAALDQVMQRPCAFAGKARPLWPLFGLGSHWIAARTLERIAARLPDRDARSALQVLAGGYYSAPSRRLWTRQPFAVVERLIHDHPKLLHDPETVFLLVGYPRQLRFCIRRGLRLDGKRSFFTAVMVAAQAGEPESVLLLLKHHAPSGPKSGRWAATNLLRTAHSEEFQWNAPSARVKAPALWNAAQRELAIALGEQPPKPGPDLQSAFRLIVSDPGRAEAEFRRSDKPLAKIGLAILLKIMRPKNTRNEREIGKLLRSAIAAAKSAKSENGLSVRLEPYNGSLASFIQYIDAASVAGITNPPGEVYLGLPCELFRKDPKFIAVLEPRFGGSGDSFLPTGICDPKRFPLPKSVIEFWRFGSRPSSGFPDSQQGTIRATEAAARQMVETEARAAPRLLIGAFKGPEHLPYESWSMLNLRNRDEFEKLRPKYLKALRDLTRHYHRAFHMNRVDAHSAALGGIWSQVYEANWAPPPRSGLRFDILNGASRRQIVHDLVGIKSSADIPRRLHMQDYKLAWRYVGKPDPLTLIAVKRPTILALLLKRGWPINEVNGLGKTALMVAAQEDVPRSVAIMLKAGTDPNATTNKGQLQYGQRTALMYAAAFGSWKTIKLLLKAGADPSIPDSRGRRAIHYLLGEGPLPPNLKLTPAQRREALRLME
jgi:Ankyrin repeats (3 copies)